jgi:hypothetical protein
MEYENAEHENANDHDNGMVFEGETYILPFNTMQ